ncbi:MAG: hypothetical protein LBT31_09615 [Synergistaceae bacterium]|jgi:hypothetical protein|nr:hypothetical protein [Synergistaceae bacterium]
MLFTISQILSEQGVEVGGSPYSGQEEILSSVFEAGNYFKAVDAEKYNMDFAESRDRERLAQGVRSSDDCRALSSELDAITRRIREISEYGKNNAMFQSGEFTEEESFLMAEARRLRSEKRELQDEIERLLVMRTGERRGKRAITYKNTVLCNTFKNMESLLPELAEMDAGRLGRIPVFTSGFPRLAERLDAGARIAVVGGPCLLGTGEMIIHAKRRDGMSFSFDFNTRGAVGRPDETDAMGKFFRENAETVAEISFENMKERLTLQDYEFLRMPLEFGRVLDAPVVIPLPDMSYMKYIGAATAPLERSIRERAMGDFASEMHRVSDIFIGVIEDLARAFRLPKLEIVHDRNKKALGAFYSGRAPFYERFVSSSRGLKAVTGQPDMVESIADYIFSPALPKYLWGVGDILQVDSLSETDSHNKCIYAHGAAASFYGALYPESLGKSGVCAVSRADVRDKEYMTCRR